MMAITVVALSHNPQLWPKVGKPWKPHQDRGLARTTGEAGGGGGAYARARRKGADAPCQPRAPRPPRLCVWRRADSWPPRLANSDHVRTL
jgi:hypothetical protein